MERALGKTDPKTLMLMQNADVPAAAVTGHFSAACRIRPLTRTGYSEPSPVIDLR